MIIDQWHICDMYIPPEGEYQLLVFWSVLFIYLFSKPLIKRMLDWLIYMIMALNEVNICLNTKNWNL